MKPTVIFELVDLALALAQTHLDADDVASTLVDIITTAIRTYEDHTGEPLDPQLVGLEGTL